jgi:hypothetical protein
MAAWKRAVVTGERKTVARCRVQPERMPGDLQGVNPSFPKGMAGSCGATAGRSGCKALSRACRRRVWLSFGSLGTNFVFRRRIFLAPLPPAIKAEAFHPRPEPHEIVPAILAPPSVRAERDHQLHKCAGPVLFIRPGIQIHAQTPRTAAEEEYRGIPRSGDEARSAIAAA